MRMYCIYLCVRNSKGQKALYEILSHVFSSCLSNGRATEVLAVERTAFEQEKKEHIELYEKQQTELREMMERHRSQKRGVAGEDESGE